jgi:hypothetical protein
MDAGGRAMQEQLPRGIKIKLSIPYSLFFKRKKRKN